MTLTPTVRTYLADPLERALSTFVQQLVVVLVATGSASALTDHTQWKVGLTTAGWAAALSLLTTYLSLKLPKAPTVEIDLVARVIKTFAQSFAGVLLASGVTSYVHADWKSALATAVPVSVLALLKGLATIGLPNTVGASLLPVPHPPAPAADAPNAPPVVADQAVKSAVVPPPGK